METPIDLTSTKIRVRLHYKQLIIRFYYGYLVMRLFDLVIGVVLLVGSVYGYSNSATIIPEIQNYLATSMPGFFPDILGSQNSMLLRMSYPAMKTMIKVTQIGFVGISVSALILLGYGIVAKKKISQIQNIAIQKINENSKPEMVSKNIMNNSLHTYSNILQILKERLAKGQITKTEFERLKKLLCIDE
jgi:uncharacterized membrane protein